MVDYPGCRSRNTRRDATPPLPPISFWVFGAPPEVLPWRTAPLSLKVVDDQAITLKTLNERYRDLTPTTRQPLVSVSPTACWEPPNVKKSNARSSAHFYATASNGWSFAPRIRSHKIAAGSPNVNGIFANRLTIFA